MTITLIIAVIVLALAVLGLDLAIQKAIEKWDKAHGIRRTEELFEAERLGLKFKAETEK